MRIAFLCSSLEPSRDGVGDYTRLLAEECVRQGHECAIIALHDRHRSEPIEAATTPGDPAIPSLRLPTAMPWRERTRRAIAFRKKFAPDWISLQFVPYGFNDKGIVAGLTKQLLEISGDSSQIHIMFHELWIGGATQSPFRQRIIGAIQRRFILNMVTRLKPAVIHTHTPVYTGLLQQAGFTASTLPLFGNIPVVGLGNMDWLYGELTKLGCGTNHSGHRSDFWLVGFFGTLHPEWKAEPLFTILRRAAQKAGKRVCLLSIGRLGTGEILWDQLARKYRKQFCFSKLGEQPTERVSQFLQYVDFGVAASPWQIIGKSGTVAAMLDHGLPVIVTRGNVQSRNAVCAPPFQHPLLHGCDPFLEMKLVAGLAKQPPRNRAPEIAAELFSAFAAVQPFENLNETNAP